MRTAAVLPVKRFDSAKQRLGDAVTGADRRELATAMVADVLAALTQVEGLDDVIVVTAEDRAAALASAAGAHVVADRDEAGQSVAAEAGVDAATARGAERALLVPGDCPALDPAELTALLARPTEDGTAPTGTGGATPRPGAGAAEVVIVADRHGEGTNALLLSPPGAITPSFGPGSLARHAARARAGGATVRVAQAPSLELDVDTPGDLAALRVALAERPQAAPRTRALLKRLAPQAAATAR
jgi:2-phospho-L-lactate/phosphoenolpyruvate guanylyltransferase